VNPRLRGYGETLGACLINGSIGVFVTWSSMPATLLVAVRMIFAGVVLGVVVTARRDWKALFADRGTTIRLLVCGVALAANLVSYFIAIRETGVAVAIFLSYLAPLYVAFVAPHLEGGRTEAAVYAALGVGVAGMALILVPGLTGEGVRLTGSGLLFALIAGLMYTVYLIGGKQLRRRDVHATTIVFAMSVLAAVILLPIGLLQSTAAEFTLRNVAIAAFLGVVCTALTFSLVMDGMQFIKVQHAAIMGYIEPVSAPLYALVILSQMPSWWTIAGGALIIGAGVIVVRYGAAEAEPELPGFALVEPGAEPEPPAPALAEPRAEAD
jgi:drug/metabolite transporter (DMT)-like permease